MAASTTALGLGASATVLAGLGASNAILGRGVSATGLDLGSSGVGSTAGFGASPAELAARSGASDFGAASTFGSLTRAETGSLTRAETGDRSASSAALRADFGSTSVRGASLGAFVTVYLSRDAESVAR